jgi:hypothetical protein
MDDLPFIGSFTVSVFLNEASLAENYHRECPHEHKGIFLVFSVLVISCVFLILLVAKLFSEKEEKIIEIAPNSHADFLERIGFAGEVPSELVCPIMQCIMQDPVRIPGGHEAHVFERTAFEKWINEGQNINPLTREPLSYWAKLVPANDVAEKIKMWLSDLRLRRHVFSIWSRGKIAGEQSKSDSPHTRQAKG